MIDWKSSACARVCRSTFASETMACMTPAEDLKKFGRLAWVPTEAQLSDILTKPMKAHTWWKAIVGPTKLTFKEQTLSQKSQRDCEPV